MARFPEVFDRPRTLEELHQALPGMTFEEVHQALRPDLSLEEFDRLAPPGMTLEEARQTLRPDMSVDEFLEVIQPDMTFDELMAVRDFSYQQHGMEPPDLSVENLEGFIRKVWENSDGINGVWDVYRAYSEAPEPNAVTDPRGFVRELGDILAHRAPDGQTAYIQGSGHKILTPENADIVPTNLINFVHFSRADADLNVGYRVYVNARADAVPGLMRGVVHEIVDRPDRFPGIHSAKVVGPHAVRSDAMVIYTNRLEEAYLVTAWLRDYQAQHPDAFLWTAPAMTHQVMEGVGIGAEPRVAGSSFGLVRSEIISEALQATRNANGDFAVFRDEVLTRLARIGVDPRHPHLNNS